MEQLEKVVIRAINGNLGLPESDTGYDSRVLAENIRAATTRLVIPKVPTREFADFLEEDTDVARFLKICTDGGDMMDAMMLHALLGIPGEADQKITPMMIAKQFPDSPFIPTLSALVTSKNLTVGGLKKAHEIAIAWHHKKLSGYVGEFWNQVRNKRGILIDSTMRETKQYKPLLPIGANERVETSYVSSILMASLIGFSYTLQKIIEMDPEFDLWARVDTLINPSRLQTMKKVEKSGRANTVIKVGIGAGVDTASGYFQVALEKCQMHRASALALYRNSYTELFATVGMTDHPFISAFSELVKRPETVRAMAEPMRKNDVEGMMQIFYSAHDDTFRSEKFVDIAASQLGHNALIILRSMESDRQRPYSTDFFEITPEGKIRVKQWMIDFVKLMNANSSRAINERIHARGCPMMHSKTPQNAGNMIFMQDFAEFFAETMEAYWQK